MPTPVSDKSSIDPADTPFAPGSARWLEAIHDALERKASDATQDAASDAKANIDAKPETEGMSAEEIRDTYDIPDFTGDGVMQTKIDKDQTVGEKAAEDFIQGIRDDVKSGKLAEDSDEAKLVDLMDAQGAVDHGYDLFGYVELIESSKSTYRDAQEKPTHLNSDDVKDIVDDEKLAEQISGLMQKESIAKRYDDALDGALDKLPDDKRRALTEKMEKALFEPDSKTPNLDFEAYVIATQHKAAESGDDKLGERLQTEVDNYFEALNALDPDAYAKRKQAFDQNLMTSQLDSYLTNPESVDPENASSGLRSTLDIFQHGINAVLQQLDKGDKSYDAYKKLGDDLKNFKATLGGLGKEGDKALLKAFNLATDKLEALDQRGNVSQAEKEKVFNAIINDNLKDVASKNPDGSKKLASSYKTFLHSASSTGTLSALTGTMSLISGGSQLANGGWDEMNSDQKLAAVRDLVSGLSFSNDFLRFGSNLAEGLSGYRYNEQGQKIDKEGQPLSRDGYVLDSDGNKTAEKGKPLHKINATDWLGLLGENFPDIWQSSGKTDALGKAISKAVNDASNTLGNTGIPTDGLSDAQKREIDKVAESIGKAQIGGRYTDADFSKNLGKSFLRFMGGAGLDVTGGVIDIVSGVNKLKSADNALERAGAGLQIGAGSAASAMALANTISMFSSAGSNLAATIGNVGTKVMQGVFMGTRVAGPVLGVAGAVLGLAGTLIAEAINHKKMQKLTDKQGEFFQDLAGYGVTQEDWGDKVEYARYATFMYGGRDAPDDESLFDFQAEEWEHFKETPDEHGSSLNRLAPYLHVDGDPDSESLWEQNQAGKTTMPRRDGVIKLDNWRPWGDTDLDATKAADPSGLPRFGDDGRPGSFKDFREDIDRVDVGSIELADGGRVIFEKDGVKQVIDPLAGDNKTGRETREEIIDYLKGLHDLARPDGVYDAQRADEMNSVFAQTDRYNKLEMIEQYLDADAPAAWDENPDRVTLFGERGSPGTFGDFKHDIDTVDVASLRLQDDGNIYFKRSGKWYTLSPNAHAKLSEKDYDNLVDYLRGLYDLTHDADGVLDKRRAAKIDELQGNSDDYNDLDDLKAFLDG